MSVLDCESHFNPSAVSRTGDIGVAQFNPKYWPDLSMTDMVDPYKAISHMAQAWEDGDAHLWTCYRKLGFNDA